MTYHLSAASKKHLSEGKPELQAVVRLALTYTTIDFSVVDCRRTIEEQEANVRIGVSWTMDSRHLPDPADNLAFAVDIYPYYDSDTDHSEWLYSKIAKAMFRAAIELGVDIEWGGLWKNPDRPHWQLSKREYHGQETSS